MGRLLLFLPAALLTGCAALGTAPPLPHQGQASGVVAAGSDTVRVMPDSPSTFDNILADIKAARAQVDVEMYEFGRGDIRDALIGDQRRGVRVTVIDDPTVTVTAQTRDQLLAADVTVVDYPVRPMMIDHVKLLIVDHQVAVIGGINWGAQSSSNHDFDVELHGPAVTNLLAVFQRDLSTAGETENVLSPVDDSAVSVLSTLPRDEIRPVAVSLIDSARQSIDLDLYVLTDATIVNALERAHARGVAIRVLLDPSQRPSDQPAAELSAAGIDVRLYRSSGELLHAKVLVTDSHNVLFGSANWSLGGFERNHEIDVAIPSNTAVAAAFLSQMNSDWNASG
jgi:phosphatidylserine/phosphatidylglycerophosphate/cardiolipin synthase-like enzyme